MGCGCGKKSKRYVDPKKDDYYSRYAFLTPAQLAAKAAKEAAEKEASEQKESK